MFLPAHRKRKFWWNEAEMSLSHQNSVEHCCFPWKYIFLVTSSNQPLCVSRFCCHIHLINHIQIECGRWKIHNRAIESKLGNFVALLNVTYFWCENWLWTRSALVTFCSEKNHLSSLLWVGSLSQFLFSLFINYADWRKEAGCCRCFASILTIRDGMYGKSSSALWLKVSFNEGNLIFMLILYSYFHLNLR